jgi:hypothetical protein
MKVLSRNLPGGTEEHTKSLSRDSRYPGVDSNGGYPEDKRRALPLDQRCRPICCLLCVFIKCDSTVCSQNCIASSRVETRSHSCFKKPTCLVLTQMKAVASFHIHHNSVIAWCYAGWWYLQRTRKIRITQSYDSYYMWMVTTYNSYHSQMVIVLWLGPVKDYNMWWFSYMISYYTSLVMGCGWLPYWMAVLYVYVRRANGCYICVCKMCERLLYLCV